jgi:hypothetical protein
MIEIIKLGMYLGHPVIKGADERAEQILKETFGTTKVVIYPDMNDPRGYVFLKRVKDLTNEKGIVFGFSLN